MLFICFLCYKSASSTFYSFVFYNFYNLSNTAIDYHLISISKCPKMKIWRSIKIIKIIISSYQKMAPIKNQIISIIFLSFPLFSLLFYREFKDEVEMWDEERLFFILSIFFLPLKTRNDEKVYNYFHTEIFIVFDLFPHFSQLHKIIL